MKNVKYCKLMQIRRRRAMAPLPDMASGQQKSPRRGFSERQALQDLDFRCLRTLGTISRHKADALVLFEGLEAVGLNFGKMREQILAASFRSNKAVALFRVEPLNDAGFHTVFPRDNGQMPGVTNQSRRGQ